MLLHGQGLHLFTVTVCLTIVFSDSHQDTMFMIPDRIEVSGRLLLLTLESRRVIGTEIKLH